MQDIDILLVSVYFGVSFLAVLIMWFFYSFLAMNDVHCVSQTLKFVNFCTYFKSRSSMFRLFSESDITYRMSALGNEGYLN